MMPTIHTIGYESATVDTFLSALVRARTQVLVDVRAIAHSRRPGFAKTAIRNNLAHAGIDYLHLSALGNPKPGRMAAWAGKDALFRSIFLNHMRTDAATEALSLLADRAKRQSACLLCLEAEPSECHRAMIADALCEQYGMTVKHLFVEPADVTPA